MVYLGKFLDILYIQGYLKIAKTLANKGHLGFEKGLFRNGNWYSYQIHKLSNLAILSIIGS